MTADEFWDNVKPILKEKGMTQEMLAKSIGVSFNTVLSWISRSRFPDGQQTFLIARTLGVSVESLFNGDSEDRSRAMLEDLKDIVSKYQ